MLIQWSEKIVSPPHEKKSESPTGHERQEGGGLDIAVKKKRQKISKMKFGIRNSSQMSSEHSSDHGV